MSATLPPAPFHAGPELEDICWPDWMKDDDVCRLKPGAVFPMRVEGNTNHDFYSQAMLVAVHPDGSAHILVDKKSISEALYNNGKEA